MDIKLKKTRSLYIPYAGPVLLEFPLLNKGSSFSMEERRNFNLLGLLPEIVETIEDQADRAWLQYQAFKTDIDKHIYLRNIQDTNETLFYRLVQNHLEEMMPVIYTPTVGAACERFSEIYRRARGVFISYQNRDHMDDIFQNVPNHNVKVIVVTDGERILGLGDQGIGGMGIPIGKLSLYTACGGISPAYTLPIVLDVGTDNKQLINDPLYMGWRHSRITGEEYYDFVDEFIKAVHRRWPDVLLQFEDFAQKNAMPLLTRYRNEICTFNDDIQGTAAVTLGTLMAASRFTGSQLSEQKIVFLGAGSAGCGIAEQIISRMRSEGLVATGSPFSPVQWQEKSYPIAQCNNAYIFPGIGLGVIASGASRITDEMLMSASEILAQHSPLVNNGEGLVLPELKDIQEVSRAIAYAVGKIAQQQSVAIVTSDEALKQAIDDNFWIPDYRDYRRTSI